VTLTGKPDPSGTAGTFAVGDDDPAPLPTDGREAEFGAPLAIGASVSKAAQP
jgi:hypothetical protein